jgi:glutaredoxin
MVQDVHPPLLVYSGPMCSGCDEVKALLTEWGIPYTEKNIRADIETMLEFRRKGYMEVPVVEGPGFTLTEYHDAAQLEDVLRDGGYLLQM